MKYCSVDCQKNHRKQHEKACKKGAAEIREKNLFTQPDGSCYGECPICCLPLPIDESKWATTSCCSKMICDGCSRANILREEELSQYPKCPYCREPLPKSQEEAKQNRMERAKVNDPVALFQMGFNCKLERTFEGAFQYYSKAAALGHMMAHYNLSLMYQKGEGVEKDTKKEVHHLEEAAIGGHHVARYNLGCCEVSNGRYERAAKNFIIAANLGYDRALDEVRVGFEHGYVSKEDYAAALRGHQAAVDATKSEQRDAAEEYYKQQDQW